MISEVESLNASVAAAVTLPRWRAAGPSRAENCRAYAKRGGPPSADRPFRLLPQMRFPVAEWKTWLWPARGFTKIVSPSFGMVRRSVRTTNRSEAPSSAA